MKKQFVILLSALIILSGCSATKQKNITELPAEGEGGFNVIDADPVTETSETDNSATTEDGTAEAPIQQ